MFQWLVLKKAFLEISIVSMVKFTCSKQPDTFTIVRWTHFTKRWFQNLLNQWNLSQLLSEELSIRLIFLTVFPFFPSFLCLSLQNFFTYFRLTFLIHNRITFLQNGTHQTNLQDILEVTGSHLL